MDTITVNREELKKIMREAFEDVLTDRKDLIEDAVLEAIEDVGLARAMGEGKKRDYVDTNRFKKKLDSRIKNKK